MSIIINVPEDTINCSTKELDKLPKRGGIYKFYNAAHELMYIGKTDNLQGRIKMHLSSDKSTSDIKHNFSYIKCFYCDCPVERDIYETYLINLLKPALNVNKVYTYKTDRWDEKYMSAEALRKQKQLQKRIDDLYFSLEL